MDDGQPWRRWVSLSLAVLLHAGFYLLLRSAGESVAPVVRGSDERIRLAWVPRDPVRTQAITPPAHPSTPAAASVSTARPRPSMQADAAAAAPAPSIPHTDQADAWSPSPAPGNAGTAGDRFRRGLLERAGPDPFAPVTPLPGLRMHDSSLGGRLQEEARRRACAELRGAMRRQAESTQAIMASMRRWDCTV